MCKDISYSHMVEVGQRMLLGDTKHPPMHRAAPHSKELSCPNVISAGWNGEIPA